MCLRRCIVYAAASLLMSLAVQAERAPVLAQVDLPHSYYWRELYLPQLTTGPSALSFMPDGDTLIYSMAGSLWWQQIDAPLAVELTHAHAAYDFQPDVAPDGSFVVFVRYDGRSMELWRRSLTDAVEQPLTSAGAVNVEPRISPDGRQLVWVSTQDGGHFNLYIAELGAQGLQQPRRLLGERRSNIERYYYSAIDHAINPSWSPDGKTLYYVGNAEVVWGSGDLWAVNVLNPSERRKVLSEETSWAARPELAPDGRRLMYSSYRGGPSHQLWLTTADGAAPLPLTFGDFDRRQARWSPDARKIGYIDNRDGNTALRVLQVVGGATRTITASQRQTLRPHVPLIIDVRNAEGQRVPARVSVLAEDGRAHAPDDAWLHGDDGFDRARQAIETQYFHCVSPCRLDVPVGATRIRIQHGFEHAPWQRSFNARAGETLHVAAQLKAMRLPRQYGDFISADLHVHMNYGGHYRNTPERLALQARAEDLDQVHNLIVNKEERIPDIAHFRPDAEPLAGSSVSVLQAQEYHTSFWGHLGLLHLGDHLLTPDFAAYRHTALSSPYPHNGVIADLAHAQGGLVGYVHPFDWMIEPAKETSLSHQLPADAIHGKVDYLEVVGFSDHRATAAAWYRLLNLGLRISAGAGTDAMANYASLRGPVGLNRVFLDTGGDSDAVITRAALKAGRGFVSNGPLLGLLVDGVAPGQLIARAPTTVQFQLALRSPVAIEHLELVHNGQVVRSFRLRGDRRSLDAKGSLKLKSGGWLLLRAWNAGADPLVLDLYPYASTNPVWLGGDVEPATVRADARYFVGWMQRVLAAAEARDDYNDTRERSETLDYLRAALARFQTLAEPVPTQSSGSLP